MRLSVKGKEQQEKQNVQPCAVERQMLAQCCQSVREETRSTQMEMGDRAYCFLPFGETRLRGDIIDKPCPQYL